MSDAYQQLLDATIQHLENLKSRGVRFTAVQPGSLTALAQAPRRRPPIETISAESATPNPVSARTIDPRSMPPAIPAPFIHDGGGAQGQDSEARHQPQIIAPVASTGDVAGAPSSSSKLAAYEDLRSRALICVKCPHLASSRKNVVFGVGSIDASLMFVGEAPGADEDQKGEPFVGKAGQLLTKIIVAMGFARSDVYIANILKCRPDMPDQPFGNRPPRPDEMATCIPYLHEQIDLIRPKVLVALGATAVKGLLGETPGITKFRGQWQTYRNIPLMPTYHPAYLLRNQAITEKRKVWEDMLAVMEKLGLPISEKQQNFFRNA